MSSKSDLRQVLTKALLGALGGYAFWMLGLPIWNAVFAFSGMDAIAPISVPMALPGPIYFSSLGLVFGIGAAASDAKRAIVLVILLHILLSMWKTFFGGIL